MHFFAIEDRHYAQFERLRREAGLAHAFSTRPVDVSVHDGVDQEERAGRRRQMAIDFGFAPSKLRCCGQVHGRRVAILDESCGEEHLEGCDAVATNLPGLALMTFSADCPLILVFDPVRRVVGMAHASWRCTAAALTHRLVETIRERFGCRPENLSAGIGPSAGPTRYEVGEDVYAAAVALPDRDRFFQRRGGGLFFDLWEANRSQLELGGIRRDNVEVAGICTISRNDIFYSYRREGPTCGHFCLLAGVVGRPARVG